MEIDDELKDLVKQAKELSEVEDKSSSVIWQLLKRMVEWQDNENRFSELEGLIDRAEAWDVGARAKMDYLISKKDTTELIVSWFKTYDDVQSALNLLGQKGYTWRDDMSLSIELPEVRKQFDENMASWVWFRLCIPKTVTYAQEKTDIKKYPIPYNPLSKEISFNDLSNNI